MKTLKIHEDCEIVRADIKAFYDSIPHAKLGKSLASIIRNKKIVSLLMQSIKVAIVPPFHRRKDLIDLANSRGVPQGLPVSNYLANFYLSNIDKKMSLGCISYHRYVDDILILAKIGERVRCTRRVAVSAANPTIDEATLLKSPAPCQKY